MPPEAPRLRAAGSLPRLAQRQVVEPPDVVDRDRRALRGGPFASTWSYTQRAAYAYPRTIRYSPASLRPYVTPSPSISSTAQGSIVLPAIAVAC
jgi:hypothetical protein